MGLSPRAIEWLRAEGHDAVHLREQGLQRISDEQVFAKARSENRVVLTFDLDFNRGSVVSAVVFRLQDTRTDRVISRLKDVLEESEGALASGAIIVIEDARHRVRRLPIDA